MVETLRAFVAISPPQGVRQALAAQLADVPMPGRVVPPANWHLTLRFLGEVDVVTFERYIAELDSRVLGQRFQVRLTGLGAFPNQRKATVAWVGVREGEQRLFQLAEVADETAVSVGLGPEERPFSPHMTLSRIRPPVDVTHLIASFECDVTWRADTVVVFESVTGRGRVRYEPIETFQLLR